CPGLDALTDTGDEVVDQLALPLVVAQRRVHDLLRQRKRELPDLVAQRHQDLLALGREPLLEDLDLLLAVGRGFRPRLVEDLAALGAGLLAQPGDLTPSLGEGVGVLLPRLLRVLLGLLRVLELLADRLLPLLDHRRDARDDLAREEHQDQDEDDQLEEERPVGDEEVVRLLRRLWCGGGQYDARVHERSAHLPRTNANSAAKARLMKYAASTR